MIINVPLSIFIIVAVLKPYGALPRPQYELDDDIDISRVQKPKYSFDALRPNDAAFVFLNNKQLHAAVMGILDQLPEEDLRALEELVPPEDLLQADMPVEDAPTAPVEDLNVTLSYFNSSDTEMPFPELQKANRESSDLDQVERNKELRLNSIKTQILSYLGLLGREPVVNSSNPNSHQREVMREMYEKMRKLPKWPPSDIYTEKVQSFYPSCEVPRNTDEELWSNGETMHLLFDLNFPTSLQGTAINIVAAKLRLYKFSQGNVTVAISETCPPPPPVMEDTVKKHPFHYPTNPAAEAITVDDKMIRVSIYWYTRSLKKHRVKRKLLDSQMVSVYGESWTEWNVKGAVKAWRESNRNFGLAVEVEDEDGNLLPTQKYFSAMNCSKEASTERPIPGFLIDAATVLAMENSGNQTEAKSTSFNFNSFMFPMIDLCTVELPESDIAEAVFYHNARYAIEQHLANVSKDPQNVTANETQYDNENDTEKHHIRHQNHHHQVTTNLVNPVTPATDDDGTRSRQTRQHIETVRQDNGDSIEEITWADDIDGHQLRKHIIVQKVIKKAKEQTDDAEW